MCLGAPSFRSIELLVFGWPRCAQAAECASQAIKLFNSSKVAGKVIPKEELRAIYSHVDADLFDYIFRCVSGSRSPEIQQTS